jgi:hypothetical protein
MRVIRSFAFRLSSAGPEGVWIEQQLLALYVATRVSYQAFLAFSVASLYFGWGSPRTTWVATAVWGLGGWIVAESPWIQSLLSRLALNLGGHAPVPVMLSRFLRDGTEPERATFRVNGRAWEFRHANIQARMVHNALVKRRALRLNLDEAKRLERFLLDQGYTGDAGSLSRLRDLRRL